MVILMKMTLNLFFMSDLWLGATDWHLPEDEEKDENASFKAKN